MGAWGATAFANDAAGDFTDTLKRGGVAKIRGALALDSDDADDDAATVAAAECIAAARGHAAAGLPEELAPQLGAWRKAFTAADVRLARRALDRVETSSELAALWRGPKQKRWLAALADLRARLARKPVALVTPVRPKRRRVKVGDIVRVPLATPVHVQVLGRIAWWSVVVVGVFPPPADRGPMLGIVAMFDRPLALGEWPLVRNAPFVAGDVAPLRGHNKVLRISRATVEIRDELATRHLAPGYAKAALDSVARYTRFAK